MDFSESLVRVQGALITLKRANGLRRVEMSEQGGELRTTALFSALKCIFDSYKHSDSDLRKIHLYLLLNSDFNFNEEVFSKDENFCHVVFTAPTLDKYLFSETILLLDFRKYIWETIVFCHVNISSEYLDALLYVIQPDITALSLPAVEVILSAIHQRLALLEVALSNDEAAKNKFSHSFKKLLQTFSPPHKDCIVGYAMKSLISLLCSCMDQRSNPAVTFDDKYKLYPMDLPCLKMDPPTEDYIDLNKGEDLRCIVSILEANLSLVDLSTWMYWSECEWESPMDDTEVSKTVQEIIGEQAFLCQQKLLTFCKDFPELKALYAVLENMAIKPVTEDDEIEKYHDITLMLPKLKESSRSLDSKQKWLKAILRMPWPLNLEEFVEYMEQTVAFLKSREDVHMLLQKVVEILKSCNSTCHSHTASGTTQNDSSESNLMKDSLENNIKNLMFQSFPKISVEEQGKLVGSFYRDFGLTNLFLTEDFENMATKTFNKVVNIEENKDELLSEICVLCLQSPMELVDRLLVLGIGCHSQISFVMEVLNILPSLSNLHVDERTLSKHGLNCKSHAISVLCLKLSILMKQSNWNETEICGLVSMVEHCLDASILQHEPFLFGCVFPGIECSLKAASWATVELHLDVLNAIFTSSSFPLMSSVNAASVLAYILALLEKGRNEMRKNFSLGAASVCESIISCLPVILEKLSGILKSEEKHLSWLKNRVLSSSPLSQYYYHKLWASTKAGICEDYKYLLMLKIFGSTEVEDSQILDLLIKNPLQLSYFLYELLPSCTTSEWLTIAHVCKNIMPQAKEACKDLYISLFKIISNVVLVMVTAAKKNITPDRKEALYCIELWFKNFMRIIKEEFWPCSKYFNARESCDVFLSIAYLLQAIPEDENIQETCSFLALSILSDIIDVNVFQEDGSDSKDFNSSDLNLKLTACISLTTDGETKKGLARKMYETLYT